MKVRFFSRDSAEVIDSTDRVLMTSKHFALQVFHSGNMSGTWTTHIKGNETNLVKVSQKLDPITAATIRTNPGTGEFFAVRPCHLTVLDGFD